MSTIERRKQLAGNDAVAIASSASMAALLNERVGDVSSASAKEATKAVKMSATILVVIEMFVERKR